MPVGRPDLELLRLYRGQPVPGLAEQQRIALEKTQGHGVMEQLKGCGQLLIEIVTQQS
jgi:hypothetical protein